MTGDRCYPREYFQRDVLNLIRSKFNRPLYRAWFRVQYKRLNDGDKYKGLSILYRGRGSPIRYIEIVPSNDNSLIRVRIAGEAQQKVVNVPFIANTKKGRNHPPTTIGLLLDFVMYWVASCIRTASGIEKPHTSTVMRNFFETIVNCTQLKLG